jgi:lysophospholipase L1-like esterase
VTTGRKSGFAILTVLLFFGAIEGTARTIWWRLESRVMAAGEQALSNDALNFMKVPHPVYGYALKANFKSPYITINGDGFHQADEIPVARRAGYLRILCLGESTTFGTGLDWNYPTFLRTILADHGRGYSGFEVINAGVPGWTSDQIALRVRHELARYKPDVAILYVGWNDFQTYDPFDAPPTVPHFDRVYAGRQWKQHATSWLKSVALLSDWYHGGDAISAAASSAASAQNTPDRRYRFLRESLADIIGTLRAHQPGIRILLSTLIGRWPDGTAEEWEKIPPVGWMRAAGVSVEQAPSYVAALNDQLRAVAEAQRADVLDLSSTFERFDRSRLQFDWAHMHADGYELMAWSMFTAMVDRRIVGSDGQTARAEALRARYVRGTKLPSSSASRPEP